MIKYELNPSPDTINWERISTLFSQVNWDERSPTDIKNSFKTSSFVLIARENEVIIGLGRTVDDGKYYALIVDVVVDPKYQGNGIGKMLVESLTKQLKGYNFVTLTAAPKKDGFYKKLGWKKQKSGYIWPKDKQQEKEHAEI